MNIMRFFGFDNDEDDYDENEDYIEERRKKTNRGSSRSSGASASNPAGKIIIYNYIIGNPTLDADKIHLRDEFNKGAMILIDLHRLTQREYEEEGKDFITFFGGMSFNRSGVMTFIAPSQYLFTPGPGMCEVIPEENNKDE